MASVLLNECFYLETTSSTKILCIQGSNGVATHQISLHINLGYKVVVIISISKDVFHCYDLKRSTGTDTS